MDRQEAIDGIKKLISKLAKKHEYRINVLVDKAINKFTIDMDLIKYWPEHINEIVDNFIEEEKLEDTDIIFCYRVLKVMKLIPPPIIGKLIEILGTRILEELDEDLKKSTNR